MIKMTGIRKVRSGLYQAAYLGHKITLERLEEGCDHGMWQHTIDDDHANASEPLWTRAETLDQAKRTIERMNAR